MKKLLIIVAAIVICLLTWRFWPQSLPNLISADETSITAFSSTVMVHRIENGQPITDTYSINTEQQSNEPSEILEILEKSSYRQDFRNLLPWDLNYVDADKNYDGRTAMLVFSVGNQKDEWVEIQFLSSSIIAVSVGDESELRIYHPTNHVILDELVEYFQTNELEIVEPYISIAEFSYAEDRAIYVEGEPGVKTSGFVNTSEVAINSVGDADERAMKECTIEYDSITTYLDTAECIWKVVFSTDGMLGGDQAVYLGYDGKTVLIVYGE